jgi:hypothetical protein
VNWLTYWITKVRQVQSFDFINYILNLASSYYCHVKYTETFDIQTRIQVINIITSHFQIDTHMLNASYGNTMTDLDWYECSRNIRPWFGDVVFRICSGMP